MKAKLTPIALLLLVAAAPVLAGVVSVPTPPISAPFAATQVVGALVGPGYSSTTSPGDPALPSRDIRVILPPDADLDSICVSLMGSKVTLLSGARDIAPSPPLAISTGKGVQYDWGSARQIEAGRNVATYARNSFYPASHVGLVHVGNLRKWRIATLRYYPYLYNPVSRRLQLASGGQISLLFSASATPSLAEESSDEVLSDQVKALTVNYAEAKDWYGGAVQTNGISAQATTNGYAIITTSAIVQGSSKLQAFIGHKTNRGFNVSLVTESQWGGGTGDLAANRIRAWLKANYLSKSLKYVLLIGGPDPSSGTVPMKMLWPRYESSTYREAPSDYFYADLTGNWDRNGDNYYGAQGDFGSGGIDLFPEVIVGRIPFYGSYTDLDSILQKTIDYESGGIGGSWVRNVLVTMKPSDANTPGYQLGEAIKTDAAIPAGFSTTRVYEQTYGLNPVPDYTPCTYTTSLSAIGQHAGFWFWWTHGNETLADQIMSTDRVVNLDDRYPTFTFQCSCLNAIPERPDNLGYALLKRGAIATDAATRVSWYYQGQVVYTNTDSNAGMTYRYAIKLVRDHMACGDAHYAMLLEVPQQIWMNHVVFNIYGDPSVAYAAAPLVTHTPLQDTDDNLHSYTARADVAVNGTLAAGNPVVKWNTNGSASYSNAAMTLVSGITYSGQIPAQPLGSTVYYYVSAQDTLGRVGTSPTTAPTSVYSFRIRSDTQAPVISHTPLTDTGITAGPYSVQASATDDCGVSSVVLRYSINGGAEIETAMQTSGGSLYQTVIPGPTQQGDRIDYYILATDTSLAHKTARSPATGYHTFTIRTSRVAVYNSVPVPPYFVGSNSNIYSSVIDALTTDPKQRFSAAVVTSLTPADLADKGSLVLPDNGVALADLAAVSNWFTSGKVLVVIDSSASYAAYSGFLWSGASGASGYGTYWDQNASVDDQKIVLQDPITVDYTLGQIIKSRGYGAQFFTNQLPADAKVLSVSNNNPTRAYAVYRDVPGAGRFVALGPYRPLETAQYPMLREALAAPQPISPSIQVTYPSGGENFDTGQSIQIRYTTSGNWNPSDRIKLDYSTGLDSNWYVVPGASSLPYDTGACSWNTSGLPASLSYRVRASLVGGSASGQCASTFSIAPVKSVSAAKATADGQLIKLSGVVVTCAPPAATYVEEATRVAGMRVNCAQPLALGDVATLTGTLTTFNGERILSAQLAQVLVGDSSTVSPIAMANASLAGGGSGYQQAVTELRPVAGQHGLVNQTLTAAGASNVGLLVRTTGKVTAVGQDYFYIDDGSRCDDGSGLVGIKVICGSIAKPMVGTRLAITGVSSTYFDRGALWRAIALPDAAHMRTL